MENLKQPKDQPAAQFMCTPAGKKGSGYMYDEPVGFISTLNLLTYRYSCQAT